MSELTDRLYSKLRHDFRSKMNVAIGYCDLISDTLQSTPGESEVADDVATVRRACAELVIVTEEIEAILFKRDPSPTRPISTLDEVLEPVMEELSAGRLRDSRVNFSNLQAEIPSALAKAVASITRKAALTFYTGCDIRFQTSSDTLEIIVLPHSAGASTIQSFANRFSPANELDPIEHFDVYYAVTTSEMDLHFSSTPSAERVETSITWSQ